MFWLISFNNERSRDLKVNGERDSLSLNLMENNEWKMCRVPLSLGMGGVNRYVKIT